MLSKLFADSELLPAAQEESGRHDAGSRGIENALRACAGELNGGDHEYYTHIRCSEF